MKFYLCLVFRMIDIEKLNKKLNYIGVDIDNNNIYELLFRYFQARDMFPDSHIDVEVSSSGKGFHIIIYKENTILENIFYRALLNDDDRRLILSLRKLYMNNNMPYFDLIFNKKGGKETIKINLEKILSDYKEDVDYIKERWGTNEALDRIRELSKKIEKYIPVKSVWTTCIKFEGEELKEKIEKVCEDIYLKDESFKYRIFPDYQTKSGYQLVIFSPNMDIAHKRGLLFVKKYFKEVEGLGYWVRKV